jgi:quercetin 2,3-dioxygenase
MQTNRTIQHILYAQPMDMGGMPIRQPFPSSLVEQIDPFLLLHHAEIKVPQHIETKHAGVGPHPHRGFSPVSFIFQGGVHHKDSRGNDNIVYAGGTQWMNAGMGIIHSERPPADIHAIGGVQELIQLWVNSPAKNKLDAPSYQPLTAEETPSIKSNDQKTIVNIISGELNGVTGPIQASSEVNTFTVKMERGASFYFAIPPTHNVFIYLMKGQLSLDNHGIIQEKNVAVFNQDGTGFELQAIEDSALFIGSGEPLNEPIASHGPFVMNNQTELMEAFRDYQMGKMGVLIED